MSLCPVEEHQVLGSAMLNTGGPKSHNMNSDIIPVLIAEDHSIKHRIMEDISIEQRKSFLNREKGLELRAIYKILSFSPDYVTTKLSSRISLFSTF